MTWIFEGDWMIVLLNLSFTGGCVALAVWLLRLVMKGMPKIYAYALWSLVLFRLFCPFTLESPFSLLPVNPEPVKQEMIYEAVPEVKSGIFFLDQPVNHMLEQTASIKPETSASPLQIWLEVGKVIWAVGVILFFGGQFISYRRLMKKLSTAVKVSGEDENVYISPYIASPLVAGIFKPRIYLPEGLEEEEKIYVLAHERVHIRRKDYLFKIAGFIALTIHWFNPVIWVSYYFMCKDMEMSCDERVVKELGKDRKKEYSETLLRFAEKSSGLLSLAFGESHTKSRIKNILKYKKPAAGITSGAFILLGLAGCTLLTNPEGTAAEENSQAISIIGGADGPTSVFLAGKISDDDQSVEYSPVDRADLANVTMNQTERDVSLDYVSQVQGQMVFHGPWGIFVYKKQNGKWQEAHSIDMKKVDSDYMGDGKSTRVIAGSTGIFIGNKTDTGWEGEPYYYDYDTKQLWQGEDFIDLMNALPEPESVGPDKRFQILENEETKEKGMPYDYGVYLMEGEHLGVLAAYGNRVLDLWFSDVDLETHSMTQAYLFHGDGQETEYQEDVREFLFTYQGYDYFLRIHEEKTGDGGGPLRKEIIRTTGNGSVEVLDTLVAGSTQGPEASDQTFRVVLAGGRLLYPGMKDDSAQAMKDSRLISINLDGSDRQTAGEDRMPYGVFHQLCTDNGYVYFEGWTNAGEFPRPIYRATPDLRTIEKIGDIDGSLMTVYDGTFYFMSTEPEIRYARLEEGNETVIFSKDPYSAKEYECLKAYNDGNGNLQIEIIKSDTRYTEQEEMVKASYKLDSTEHVKERLKAGE